MSDQPLVTIHFSLCTRLEVGGMGDYWNSLPIQRRCASMEAVLECASENLDVNTYDENLVLIAQWLHRRGKIRLRLVNVCACGNSSEPQNIDLEVDDEGDMNVDPCGGFFPQRLKYLR